MAIFDIRTPWQPTADQPKAIAQLVEGLKKGFRYQTLLGATGTGKTMTIANAIAQAQPGDGVLIAGKGHEDYQIIGTEKIHFDDREEARSALEKKYC